MGIDKTQLDKIIAQNKSKGDAVAEVKASLDTSKLDSIIDKYKDVGSPESKERAETMMSIGKLNTDLMGGQLSQIGKDIPDFSNKWAYEYLSTNSEGVDAENIEGAKGAAEAIKKSHSIKQTEPMRGLALKERIENNYDSIRGEATDNDFVATKYAMARNLVDDLPLADPADKEWVMVGDQRMPRGQAEQVLADIVDDTMHPTLMQSNKAYRDNWFIENTGFNAKDYLMSIDETLAKLQQTLNTEVGKEIDAVRSTTTALQMAENAGIDPAIAQAFVTNEQYGGKAIRDMRDQIRSLVDNDFSSGVKEGFDAISMMTAGLNDLMAGVELNSVLNKAYNDEPLTEREKIAFEAYVVGQQIDELEELFGGRSWINRVGQGVGTSAEMAVGFMAGTGVAGNIGKLSSLPIRAAAKTVRRAAQKGTWNALKTAVVRSGQLAGRSLKNVAVAEGAGLIAAPLLPSTYATFAEKRNEQFSVENGRIVYKPTRAWKDVIDSWIEGGTEIGSEVIGARIGELIGGSARAFGRALALDKLAAKAGIGKASNMIFGWQKPAAFKALERSVGYQGAVAEPLSEVWGDALSNLMKEGITGNGDLSQLKDVDYWTTTLATCAIYGGSLQAASAPHAIARYSAIAKEGVARKKALSKIGSTELHDKVVAALSIDNIDDAAKAFASIDWGNSNYHRSDIGYAMDALRADYAQRVAIANQVEDGRMSLFLNRAEAIENMEYRGTEGMTPKGVIKVVTDKNGVAYTAMQGDKSKEFYICLDANGNKVSIPSSTIVSEKNYALTDQMMYAYSDMYSVSNEQERQRNIIAQYNRMRKDKGSAEAVKTVMDVFGVKQYYSGEDVTLVNGETATVEDFVADTGEFIVSLHNGGMETVPFYSVLSESELTADAQKLNNSADVVTNVEAKLDVEERAETTTEPRTTRFVEGDIVITPAGEKARVREVNEDGTYEVDYNTAETVNVASMVLESFAEADLRMEGEEVAQTEAPAAEEAEVAETQPTAETIEETTIPEAKPIPTNEDGSINFDAIEDPEQFASLYEREVGSREAAMADVVEMRDSAQVDLAESLKKGKKSRNANDKIANRKAQQALAERVNFYNKVLDVLSPAEVVEQTTETPAIEEQTTEAEVSVETPSVGLIRSEMDADLRSDIAETIDAMAKALGLRVRFVDAVADGTANAEIVGNEVRIAWMKRDSAVSFLVGHEFTHRMQDLSPEAYAAFKESVKKYLGEEAWNARITETKKRYKNISETEIEDETLADFVGEMVENEGAFVKYLEANKENKSLLESIAEVFKAIFDALAKVVKRNDAYTDVLNKLNTLISTAEAKANEGAETHERRESKRDADVADIEAERSEIEEEVGEELGVKKRSSRQEALLEATDNPKIRFSKREDNSPIFFSNAQYAVQNIKQEKATPEQWLKMIEKNGGLKAGEDKWLGLSDWLKASDKKTLTKDEVLQYIAENDIQIEEVSYSESNGELLDRVRELTNDLYYVDQSINDLSESITRGKRRLKELLAEKNTFDDKAEALKQEFGENSPEYKNHLFYDSYTDDIALIEARIADDERYYAQYSERANALRAELDELDAEIGDESEINSTRLGYTTQGLTNKREIALTVPTIEPWNTSDNIHFGDAGEGRAVAWVRFGETTTPSYEYLQADISVDSYLAQMREKYNAAEGEETDYMTNEEIKQLQNLTSEMSDLADEKKRVLVIDEIQSKRHQEGREKGYSNPRVIEIFTRLAEIESNLYSQGISMEMQTEREALKAELESIFESENPVMKSLAEQIEEKKSKRTELVKEKMNEDEEKAEIYRLREKQNQVRNVRDYDDYEAEISEIEDRIEQRHEDIDLLNSNIVDLQLEYSRLYNREVSNVRVGVSPAPFEKNWAELAFKRMLRYAAENGYDYVAWTTGDQQAERYNIGAVLQGLKAYKTSADTYYVIPYNNGAIGEFVKEYTPRELTDTFGKELAVKIVTNAENATEENPYEIEGEELRIGGEGMRGFYDQMLPSFVKKYTKKWGAEVKDITMPELEENNTMHAVNVTDAMRESVMQGQPKFSMRDETTQIFDAAKTKFGTTYDDAGNIIPLSERFNPEKEDIRYSMQTPSLVGVHNISLDKLRKVIKMGGLANPSVAVIDVDKQTHDDYGEYSLILPKNMVDARQGKNAGTWAGDAWTPTYPQVVKRMTDDKAISRFYKDIDTLPDAMRSRIRLDFDSFMEARSANSLAYWYLFEKGNAPALVYIPSRYPEDITNAVEEATNGSFSMYGLTPEERAKCLDAYIAVKFDGDRVAFETEMQGRIDRLTETIETK